MIYMILYLAGINTSKRGSVGSTFGSDLSIVIVFGALVLLVILNIMLYYKLWALEETPPFPVLELPTLK